MATIYWLLTSYLLAICSYLLAVYWLFTGYLLAIYWLFTSYLLAITSYLLAIYWLNEWILLFASRHSQLKHKVSRLTFANSQRIRMISLPNKRLLNSIFKYLSGMISNACTVTGVCCNSGKCHFKNLIIDSQYFLEHWHSFSK